MNTTPILDRTPEPRREDFQDQEVFEREQHRWRWTIGRSQALRENPSRGLPQIIDNQTPDPMQPAVDAIEAWLEQRSQEARAELKLQESNTPK